MGIFKLKPVCKDYLWGGHRLVDDFGIDYDGDICAEAWVLSCHKDGESLACTDNGDIALSEFIRAKGKEILGTNCRDMEDFPILIKFIDAKKALSIQVHPDEEYAMAHEGDHGKTEMWYVLDADEGSFVYQGFEKEISTDEFKKRIEDNTLEEVLHKVPVKRGDVIFITPGCLHAIGKGVLVAEIQRSSNVTYRIYDYGRVGADGKTRPLHISQAIDVTRLSRPDEKADYGKYLVDCEFFKVEDVKVTATDSFETTADDSSFVSVIVVDGEVTIRSGSDELTFKKGESAFIPAGTGYFTASGEGELLVTRV